MDAIDGRYFYKFYKKYSKQLEPHLEEFNWQKFHEFIINNNLWNKTFEEWVILFKLTNDNMWD